MSGRAGLFDQHPFTGFDVVAQSHPERSDAQDAASALMLTIVEDWLRPDPDVATWEISEPTEGSGDNAGEYTIHLGPIDEASDDFAEPILIVVRQTAGGGLMVLLSYNGRAHADRISRYAAAALDRREGDAA